MLVPCTLPAQAAAPAVQVAAPNHALRVFRHGKHRIHHAIRAASHHTGSLVSTACHTVPGALAIAALGVVVPSPTTSRPSAAYVPAMAQPSAPSGQTDGAPGWILSPLPGTAMGSAGLTLPAGSGSALIALTPAEVPPSPTAVEILAPFIATPSHNSQALPTIVTTNQGLPVPEPSSLSVFACAFAAMVLGRRPAIVRPLK